jgi:hypothetical protein
MNLFTCYYTAVNLVLSYTCITRAKSSHAAIRFVTTSRLHYHEPGLDNEQNIRYSSEQTAANNASDH